LIFIGTKECDGEPMTMMVSPSQEVRIIDLPGAVAVEWLNETRADLPTYAVASTEQAQFLITTHGEVLPIAAPPAAVAAVERLAGVRTEFEESAAGMPFRVAGTDVLLWAGKDGLWIGSLTDPASVPVQLSDGRVVDVLPLEGTGTLLWAGEDGLWIGSLTDPASVPVQILDGRVFDVFPSADADHLVIFADSGLWVASPQDGFRPVLIDERTSSGAFRVEP
jgi:hypothetical protein